MKQTIATYDQLVSHSGPGWGHALDLSILRSYVQYVHFSDWRSGYINGQIMGANQSAAGNVSRTIREIYETGRVARGPACGYMQDVSRLRTNSADLLVWGGTMYFRDRNLCEKPKESDRKALTKQPWFEVPTSVSQAIFVAFPELHYQI